MARMTDAERAAIGRRIALAGSESFVALANRDLEVITLLP